MKESILKTELEHIVDMINGHLKENKMEKSIWFDITTNSRMIDTVKNVISINKAGKKQELDKRKGTKRQHYGLIRLFQKEYVVNEEGKKVEARFLLYNIEYAFKNPSDQLNTYYWHTQLCRAMMYECLGGFVALARGVFEQQKAEQSPNISLYDSEKNTYTPVNPEEKKN